MGKRVNVGGERLGSGAKMEVELKGYERSTHDLGYIWRNTQAVGTLVPFMSEVMLPEDTFDIELNADVKTLPTVGPLFASFKLQLDVFKCPWRLYIAKLHNNKLGIGMNMSQIKIPQLELVSKSINPTTENPVNEAQQINKSALLNYLGISGIGTSATGNWNEVITRHKNAIPYIAMYDIYKNYYANKQEEIGAFINQKPDSVFSSIEIGTISGSHNYRSGEVS